LRVSLRGLKPNRVEFFAKFGIRGSLEFGKNLEPGPAKSKRSRVPELFSILYSNDRSADLIIRSQDVRTRPETVRRRTWPAPGSRYNARPGTAVDYRSTSPARWPWVSGRTCEWPATTASPAARPYMWPDCGRPPSTWPRCTRATLKARAQVMCAFTSRRSPARKIRAWPVSGSVINLCIFVYICRVEKKVSSTIFAFSRPHIIGKYIYMYIFFFRYLRYLLSRISWRIYKVPKM